MRKLFKALSLFANGVLGLRILWEIAKRVWGGIGHIGNLQTLWDIVNTWPVIWRDIVYIASSWWFQLAASIICLVAWYLVSRHDKKDNVIHERETDRMPNDIEQKVRQWIDAHGFKHGNVFNGIQVLIPPRFIVTIGRQKDRPSWLMLKSSILMSENQRSLFAKMPKEKKMSLFRAIRIECGRSEVEHHTHNDGSRRLVCIQKQIPITGLTESQLIDSINKMHFATDVVMDTIDILMPPDKALLEQPAAELQFDTAKPLTGIRLRNEYDKWIESGKALRERLVTEGKVAIPEAKKWLQEFHTFAELNLSVSDYDAVNAVTPEDTFNQEMTKVDPSHEVKGYQRLVGHRYGQLYVIRNKIK